MSSLEGILESVIKLCATQLDVDENQITPDSSFVDDLGADSLALVELVLQVEESFQIDIPDEDAENFKTPLDVAKYIFAKNQT